MKAGLIFQVIFVLPLFLCVSCKRADVNHQISEQALDDLQGQVSDLAKDLAALGERKESLHVNNDKLVGELTQLVKDLESKIKKLEEKRVSVSEDGEKADVEELRRVAREKVIGETHAKLVTTSGKKFSNVKVMKVTDYGVTFRYKNRFLRVPYWELPQTWHERLFVDWEKVAIAQEENLAKKEKSKKEKKEKEKVEKGRDEMMMEVLERLKNLEAKRANEGGFQERNEIVIRDHLVEPDRVIVVPHERTIIREVPRVDPFRTRPSVRPRPTIRPTPRPSRPSGGQVTPYRPTNRPVGRPTSRPTPSSRPVVTPPSRPVVPSRPTNRPVVTRPTRK